MWLHVTFAPGYRRLVYNLLIIAQCNFAIMVVIIKMLHLEPRTIASLQVYYKYMVYRRPRHIRVFESLKKILAKQSDCGLRILASISEI